MMTINFLKDRTMVIKASGAERSEFKAGLRSDRKNENSLEDRRMETEILHWLSDNGYSYIAPESIGALTSAPIVGDDPENPTEVWAFTQYAVTSIPMELAEFGFATLQHSPVESGEPKGEWKAPFADRNEAASWCIRNKAKRCSIKLENGTVLQWQPTARTFRQTSGTYDEQVIDAVIGDI